MATFDASDKDSWYFGSMSRADATEILMNEKEGGVFLVRDSKTILGDFVLCVREDTKVSHYIINRIPAPSPNSFYYRIGDQSFHDLSELLGFYKLHYLDTTPLRRPAKKVFERVICKFDFEGSDGDDLPFKKGEILFIVNKDEEQWWTAKNAHGKQGQIPVPYVEKYDESQHSQHLQSQKSQGSLHSPQQNKSGHHHHQDGSSPANTQSLKKSNLNRKLPALARVKQARVPNAYDKTALKLEVGDIITVTKMNINGQWEGELKGKVGHFPFTHVEFIDDGSAATEPSCDMFNDQNLNGNSRALVSNSLNNNGSCGNVNNSNNLILNNSLIDDK